MAQTRPIGEQLRFLSSKSGNHILDDYLEAAEKGNRTLSDMLGDLFNSTTGVFRSDLFQFREDPSNPGYFQVRVGQFVNADTGWTTITFTDFAQYVADALAYKNAAETAKTQAQAAHTAVMPILNSIDNVNLVAGSITNVNTVSGQIAGTKTYTVTASGGEFYLDGVASPAIEFKRGWTYTFDLSDSSLSTHPFRFSNNANNSPASQYTNGVTVTGTQGTTGAKIEIVVASDAPNSLHYYCTAHSGMGDSINVKDHNLDLLASIDTAITTTASTVAPSIGNVNIVATDIANVNTVATNIADVNTVAADTVNVNNVGGSIANVNTVATNLPAINTVSAGITNVGTVASNISDVNDVVTNLSDITTVAAKVGSGQDITVVASGIGNVQTVATSITAVNTVATNISKVTEVANDLLESLSEIDTVATNIADVNTVGTNISAVTSLANNANWSSVVTVGNSIADVNTLAGINSKISALADIEDGTTATNALTGLHSNLASITPLGANIANIVTLANSISSVNTVASDIANVNTVAPYVGTGNDVTLVGQSITDVNNVASNLNHIQTLSGISSDVTTTANNATAISSIGANISGLNTIASYMTQILQADDYADDAKKYATHGVNSTFTDSDGNIEYSAKHYAATAQAVGTAFTTILGDERTSGDTDDITADNGADSLQFYGLGGAKVRTDQNSDAVYIDSRSVAMAVALG